MTWTRYKDKDEPASTSLIHPCLQVLAPSRSTLPPSSSRSSPHRTNYPQKPLLCAVPILGPTMSRGVVPQSIGPHPSYPRPLHLPALTHRVNLISPSTSHMAGGRGHMVSRSTTQNNFCPCEVGILFACLYLMLNRSQRAPNAPLPSTAGLSVAKRSNISAESKCSDVCHPICADMPLRWNTSKQKEWYGFYSEVRLRHTVPVARPTSSFASLPYTSRNSTFGPFRETPFRTSSAFMSCPKQ